MAGTWDVERPATRILFSDFELDLEEGELRRGDEPVPLFPKPLSLLLYLVTHRERAVPKQELLEQVWPDVFVSETALASALKDLRRALGDDGASQRIIQTRRRRGYRFVATLRDASPPRSAPRAGDAIADAVRSSGAGVAREGIREWAAENATPPLFVGRARELAWLEDRVREAQAGRPRFALIKGEAGVGKTRLLAELAEASICADFEVAIGRCHEEATVPYLPFVEALSSWLVQSDASSEQVLGDDLRLLRQLLEPAGVAAGCDPPTSSDGKRERMELFAAVSRAVIRLAQQRRTVLVIEDLHWADQASLDLLAHLAAALGDVDAATPAPLLLVATHRPPQPGDELARALARIEREAICQCLSLQGLDEVGARQLLAALGVDHPAPGRVQAIEEATRGNPLFIREIVQAGGPARLLGADRGDESLPLPEDLQAAVGARVAQVSPACREVLTVAAFIGERFGLLALGAACELDAGAVGAAISEGVQRGLVQGERRSFRFDHPMIRHVLLRSASELERHRIHAALADVLEDLYATASGEHAMEIAGHLRNAGDRVEPARLMQFARRAADQALAVCAWREAARFYDDALRGSEHSSAEERAALHYRAGLAYNHDLDVEPCIAHYRRAIEGFEACGDLVGLAWAHMYLLRARFTIASVAPGTKLDVEPVMTLAARLADRHPALAALLLETIAEAHWTAGDSDLAASLAGQALVIGHNLEDDVVSHHACLGLGLARFSRLEVREALDSWRDALAHARRSRDPWLTTTPSGRIPMALLHLGRLSEARAVARDAADAARRAQNASELSFALAQQACLELAEADFQAVEECVRGSLTLMERSSYPWGGFFALCARACAAGQRGDFAIAHAALQDLVRPGRVFADPGPAIQLMVAIYTDLLHALEGRAFADADCARVRNLAALASLAGPDTSILGPLCALVEIAGRRGLPEVAASAEPVLLLAAERGVVLSNGFVFAVPRMLGIAATLRGAHDEAEVRLVEAERLARAVDLRAELAHTLLDDAALLCARRAPGDVERAGERLAEAMPLIDALDLVPAAARARSLAASRERPRTTRPARARRPARRDRR